MREVMKADGYFTVEAALVLPVVLAEVILVICLFLYQYNRCVMEMDAGILALRGSMMDADSNQERIEELKRQAETPDWEKYLAWERESPKLKIERGALRVEQSGQLYGKDSAWGATRVYESHVFSPVLLIRTYRRMIGGK